MLIKNVTSFTAASPWAEHFRYKWCWNKPHSVISCRNDGFFSIYTIILTLTGSKGCWEKMFDPLSLSSGWWMSPRCLAHKQHSLISCLHLAETRQCAVAPAASSSATDTQTRKSPFSFFFYIKKEASHKQAPLLMKDSRSDWLAVMQIKLQRCSTEWADRHAALQCLHEERNQRSLKLRKQDQRNKWRSISPEEVYRLTGMYRMCRGFNCWYIMRLSVLLSKADGDSNVVMNPL